MIVRVTRAATGARVLTKSACTSASAVTAGKATTARSVSTIVYPATSKQGHTSFMVPVDSAFNTTFV